VDSQNEETRIGAGNTVVRGMVVYFHTQYGAVGSVFVPSVDYSVSNVQMMITARAAAMDEIHTLTG
jgi:hypothetical protein